MDKFLYIANLVVDYGCHGPEPYGYAVYDHMKTRSEVEQDWCDVNKFVRSETLEYDKLVAESNLGKTPVFDERWIGTLADFEREKIVWDSQRSENEKEKKVFVAKITGEVWKSKGAVIYDFESIPSFGGEYDDVPDGSYALTVIDDVGCRCWCGGYFYSDEAEDSDVMQPFCEVVDSFPGLEMFSLFVSSVEVEDCNKVLDAACEYKGEIVGGLVEERKVVEVWEGLSDDEKGSLTWAEIDSYKCAVKNISRKLRYRDVHYVSDRSSLESRMLSSWDKLCNDYVLRELSKFLAEHKIYVGSV